MQQERTTPRELAVGVPASFAAGVLVGLLGTFKHQFGVSAATGSGPPIGLVLSVLMVGLLLAALRLAFPTRWFALAAALGVVGAVVLLLFPGPSGSEVVLLNYAGLTWTVAPAVVAAAVVGWPRRALTREAQTGDGILGDGRNEGRS